MASHFQHGNGLLLSSKLAEEEADYLVPRAD